MESKFDREVRLVRQQPRDLGDIIPSKRDDPDFYRIDKRPNPSILAGLFRIGPFTDFSDAFTNAQSDEFCGPMEMRMMNCLEAYGLPRGFKRCNDYMKDFSECCENTKQMARVELMRKERRRQFNSGERSVKYAVPPKMGSFQY